MSEYIENKIETIESDIEYVLLRPNIYFGSMEQVESTELIINSESNKAENKTISYTAGLVKSINELIDNSFDEAVRTNYEICNKISINITETPNGKKISIQDNGRGVPVESAEAAWTSLKTGSNFRSDETSTTIGTNGVGSSVSNILSLSFKGVTVNSKGERGTLICSNNLSSKSYKTDNAPVSVKQGTLVEIIPDYKRFGVTDLTQEHIDVLYTRLVNLAISYPKVTITFNGKMIKASQFKDYVKFYSEHNVVLIEDERIMVSVFPSDEFKFIHLVNGLSVYDGGNLLNYVTTGIITKLTERIQKSYKKITTGNVKSKLGFIVIIKNQHNLKFSNQMKSKITNNYTETGLPLLPFVNYAEQLYKNKHIITDIIELYRIQMELEKRKALTGIKKENKKERVEGHIKSTGPTTEANINIVEGDSAKGLAMNILDRKTNGFYAMTGVIANVTKMSPQQLSKNKVVNGMINTIGFNPSNPKDVSDIQYKNIVILTDEDMPGLAITGLLINLVNKFAPDMIKEGRLKRLGLPMMIAFNKGKIENYFFNFSEYEAWKKSNDESKYTIKFFKGLATYSSKVVEELFSVYGKDTFYTTLNYEETTDTDLENWFSDNVDWRKSKLTSGVSLVTGIN